MLYNHIQIQPKVLMKLFYYSEELQVTKIPLEKLPKLEDIEKSVRENLKKSHGKSKKR